jgi:alpha-mannosidase
MPDEAKPVIHLIANSHIDPVWLWDRYEGIDEVINTFRSACDRLDEYPSLKFIASSIIFYKWVEQYAPEVFERIKAHVLAQIDRRSVGASRPNPLSVARTARLHSHKGTSLLVDFQD